MLLRHCQPTECETNVYNHTVHDVLVINGCEYRPSAPADLLEIAELCKGNGASEWVAAISAAHPASIRSSGSQLQDEQMRRN